MPWCCPLCSGRFTNFTRLREYLKHIRLCHSDEPNFRIDCAIHGCWKTFKNFYTYRNHMYAFHNSIDELDNDCMHSGTQQGPSNLETGNHGGDRFSDDNDSGEENLQCTTQRKLGEKQMKNSAAIMILKMREKYLLPQSVTENLVQDMDSLYQVFLESIGTDVIATLQKNDVDSSCVNDVQSTFSPSGIYGNMFRGIGSYYQHTKFCRENFNLVEPQSVVLGEVRKHKGTGAKRTCVSVNEVMMYVPLLSSLEAFLQHEIVMSEVHRSHFNEQGRLEDYCDGENFKEHPLFSTRVNALQLFFYYDDVEVCNPLGSKRTKHKIGFFYYAVGNLSPKFRSRLGNIQLAMVVKKKLITKYGMNAVMEPLLNDVKKLEAGATFNINGNTRKMFGTIVSISADNLGANALGGFKEGSFAHRGCRHCMITSDNLSTTFQEDTTLLRTLVNHRRQCDLVEEDNNKVLRNHDNSLRQNASQMWLLGRLLPCMIGRHIPKDDAKWQNLSLLLQIVDLLFATAITADEAVYLQMLIQQHHEAFAILYPDKSITPKMHYMIHMPRIIIKFGPLIRHWTMRFEARHKYFKRLAGRLGNFINIAHTLAQRYQQLQCYYSLDSKRFENEIESGPNELVLPNDRMMSDFRCTSTTQILKTSWVEIYGTLYKRSCCLVIQVKEDLLVFGELKEIYNVQCDIYFKVQTYTTLWFDEHFHAYVVEATPTETFVKSGELLTHEPLHFRSVKGLTKANQQAVVLKHHISYD